VPPERVERKLAAILAADVAGYSRLMGADEEGTLARLKAHRRELIDPKINEYRGRIVKTTGDGILIEFPSAVEAVRCAIEVQRGMVTRNAGVPPDKQLQFRVGINLGDIIVEGKDIYGDGVNVAARLEALAEPGGICVSRGVRDPIRDKLPFEFSDLGERTVKNITRPIEVFGLSAKDVAALPEMTATPRVPPPRRSGAVIAAAMSLVVIAAAAAWWWHGRQNDGASSVATSEQAAHPKPRPLSERPTIAVLPFVTLSAAAADDYFGDGLTEDIIAALGRFSDLSVLARNAVFPYKGKSLRPDDMARELGARYLVEGTIRRTPERIRVSVQLTDATKGTLLWSTQYDVESKDVFSVQDDITRRIAGALAVSLTRLEQARAAAKPPSSLEAYDLVLRGRELMARQSRSANAQARDLFQRAIDLDPAYAAAYVGLGFVNRHSVIEGWTADPVEALQRAESLATKAISLEDSNAGAHALLGAVYLQFGQHERAINELQRALDLNPSDANTYGRLGSALLFTGQIEESIKANETALHLDPNPDIDYLWSLGTAYFLAGRTADATRTLEGLLARNPNHTFSQVMIAAVYAQADRPEDAGRAAAAVHRLNPFFDRSNFGSLFRNPEYQAKIAAALGKAGL
jgi:class 3 adenylate cyclase/TolB-like protein/cytochrome c-type biogenesis protein CcmH/NrfG